MPVTGPPTDADLAPTAFMDVDDPAVRAFVDRVCGEETTDAERARRLFAAVRDEIRYDPYGLPVEPEDYRASAVLDAGSGYCIQKSVVLSAAARAAGIPARLGFADVRNHLQSDRLREEMGTDLFIYHGYSTLWIDGQWRKASAAFNRELCERFGVEPLDFDGSGDALLHAFSGDGARYMEYVRIHGDWDDLPLSLILDELRAAYPRLATR